MSRSRRGSGFQQINELIGSEATRKLCLVIGGVSHYIPKKAKPEHRFARLIGTEAFEALCADFGGTRLTLPTLNELKTKSHRVRMLLREGGWSVRKIAEEVGCTERYASMVSADFKRSQTKPLPLFDASKDRKARAAQLPPDSRGADVRSQQHGRHAAMK
jgi:hypothetical protein